MRTQGGSIHWGVPWRINPVGLEEQLHWPLDRRLHFWWNCLRIGKWWFGVRHRRQFRSSVLANQLCGVQGDDRRSMRAIDPYNIFEAEPPPLLNLHEGEGWQTTDSFRINTDQSLGGHSEAFLETTEEGNALFHGTLRITRDPVRMAAYTGSEPLTEEHCGFATITIDWPWVVRPTMNRFRAVEIRCRGSQHPFFASLGLTWHDSRTKRMHMFVPVEEWRCYVLRFDHFRLVKSGMEIPTSQSGPRHNTVEGKLKNFAVGINCGEEDDFWLEIDYIRLMGPSVFEWYDSGPLADNIYEKEHDRYG